MNFEAFMFQAPSVTVNVSISSSTINAVVFSLFFFNNCSCTCREDIIAYKYLAFTISLRALSQNEETMAEPLL